MKIKVDKKFKSCYTCKYKEYTGYFYTCKKYDIDQFDDYENFICNSYKINWKEYKEKLEIDRNKEKKDKKLKSIGFKKIR